MHYLCENELHPFSKPGNALFEAEKCPFDTENAPLCKARKLICGGKIEVNITLEIVKWDFWCKLPLLQLLWYANAIDEVSNFPIYSFTNDLLSQFIRFGLYEMS